MHITTFPTKHALTKASHDLSWCAVLELLRDEGPHPDKGRCPWLKLATFGDQRSDKGCYRTNANVVEVTGVEGDYDKGEMSLETAKNLLEEAGIKAILYTSASHAVDAPRWRVLAPLSRPHAPGERGALLARINGVLGGILAPESFVVSQAYYYGRVEGGEYTIVATFDDPSMGEFIDFLDGLDAGAVGKQREDVNAGVAGVAMFEERIESLGRRLVTGDGRRDFFKSYIAKLVGQGLGETEIMYALEGVERDYFDDADPFDRDNIRVLVEDMVRANQTSGFEYALEQSYASDTPRYKLLSRHDIAAWPPIAWCVRGILPAVGLAGLYGPSASGKSFLALDLAAAIAEGERWFGCRVCRAPVVYVVLEGEGGLKVRVDAWESARKRNLPNGMSVVAQSFKLTELQDLADLVAVVPKNTVVFIDTLNRAAPTADENSSRDMGEILEAAKRLQNAMEGLVVLIHHTGKDVGKGLRGHSSLFAALDAAIEVSRTGEQRTWKVAKSKDGADGLVHGFRLETVGLGVDSAGEPVSSCVVAPTVMQAITRKPLTPSQECAMASYRAADLFGDGAEVALEIWRKEFYAASPAKTAGAKRKAFNRALIDLERNGYVTAKEDIYSLNECAA